MVESARGKKGSEFFLVGKNNSDTFFLVFVCCFNLSTWKPDPVFARISHHGRQKQKSIRRQVIAFLPNACKWLNFEVTARKGRGQTDDEAR